MALCDSVQTGIVALYKRLKNNIRPAFKNSARMTRMGLTDTDKRSFFSYRRTAKRGNKSVKIRPVSVIRACCPKSPRA
jgi:hypothetical protein